MIGFKRFQSQMEIHEATSFATRIELANEKNPYLRSLKEYSNIDQLNILQQRMSAFHQIGVGLEVASLMITIACVAPYIVSSLT